MTTTTFTAGNSNSSQTDYEKYQFGPKPGQSLWAEKSAEYKRGYHKWQLTKNVPKEMIQDLLCFVAADDLASKEKDQAAELIEHLLIEFTSGQPRLRETEELMTQLFGVIGVSQYAADHQAQLKQDLGIYLKEVIARWVS